MLKELESVNEPQVLRGEHCQVTYELVQEIGKRSRWIAHFKQLSNIGSESGTQNDRIAFFIASLPDPTLLEGCQNLHYGVLQRWIEFRDTATEIAIGFLSEEFLYILLSNGLIDDWSYEYTKLEAALYKNLWLLIRNQNSVIEPIFRKNWDYPFESNLDLFKQIVREDLEGEFSRYLLEEYQYKAKEIHEIDKLKRKMHRGELTPSGEKELWNLIDQHAAKAIWFDRLITVADGLAKQGSVDFPKYVDIHDRILYDMSKLRIQDHPKSKQESHKRPSHYCLDGVHYLGVKPKWKA